MKVCRSLPKWLCAVLTMVGAPAPAGAADAAFFGMLKTQFYRQTNAAAPVALSSNGFAFNAFVFAGNAHVVTNATVRPGPGTSSRPLLPDASETVWLFDERFHTQSALDAVYPNGNIIVPVNYTMTMSTGNDGVKSAGLSFAAAALLGPPPTPQITSLAAAQSIDTSAGFTLRWTANGLAVDLVQVLVFDAASNTVAASPVPFAPGALTGQSNSFTIPPNTLPPGAGLTGHITLARPGLPNTNSYPGAIGVPALVRDTEFPLATRPAPVPPRLEVRSPGAAPFELRFLGEADRNYHLQASGNFLSWSDLLVTNSPTGQGTYTDPSAGGMTNRFYRIQVGP